MLSFEKLHTFNKRLLEVARYHNLLYNTRCRFTIFNFRRDGTECVVFQLFAVQQLMLWRIILLLAEIAWCLLLVPRSTDIAKEEGVAMNIIQNNAILSFGSVVVEDQVIFVEDGMCSSDFIYDVQESFIVC